MNTCLCSNEIKKMASAKDRGREYYFGEEFHECMVCGTLVSYKWDDDDRCSCETDD